jgi:hypothetical protein
MLNVQYKWGIIAAWCTLEGKQHTYVMTAKAPEIGTQIPIVLVCLMDCDIFPGEDTETEYAIIALFSIPISREADSVNEGKA